MLLRLDRRHASPRVRGLGTPASLTSVAGDQRGRPGRPRRHERPVRRPASAGSAGAHDGHRHECAQDRLEVDQRQGEGVGEDLDQPAGCRPPWRRRRSPRGSRRSPARPPRPGRCRARPARRRTRPASRTARSVTGKSREVEDGADLRLRGGPRVRRVAGALHRAGHRDQLRPPPGASDTHQPAASTRSSHVRGDRLQPGLGAGAVQVVEHGEPGVEGLRDPRRDPAAAPAPVVAGRVDVLAGRRPGRPPPASAARPAWRGTARRRPAGAAGPGCRRARRASRWRPPRRRPRCSSAARRPGGTPPRRPGPRPRSARRSRRCRTRRRRSGPPGCRAPGRWPG